MNSQSGKGFTLVEILVVLSVIGILATFLLTAFGGARAQVRDRKRVTDLEQVRQSLQLFYLKCGFYPGRYAETPGTDGSRCRGGRSESETDKSAYNPVSWDGPGGLEEILSEAEIGVPQLPQDPLPGEKYSYWVQLESIPAVPRAQCYVLHAGFESESRALEKDLDNQNLIDSLDPACPTVDCKNLYPDSPLPECDENPAVGSLNYCTGNIECFHGL